MASIQWQENPFWNPTPTSRLTPFTAQTAEQILTYHRSWPHYQKTPLWRLEGQARALGLRDIWIKDESYRWGLRAFKGLGGTYAVGRCLARQLGLEGIPPYAVLTNRLAGRPPVTFATATDGNHGVGVAWAAAKLGQQAHVFLPRGSTAARLNAVTRAGGQVHASDLGYDDLVEWVALESLRQGWTLVQDTAWDGYTEIPMWIMQGYLTSMAEEFLAPQAELAPTHVFLQAGVGSFAAAITAFLANVFGPAMPRIILMEPHSAACFYRTARSGEATLQSATGPINTVMAGLACGVGSPIAWDILRPWVSAFVSLGDSVTEHGIRVLAQPCGSDPAITSGESGAVGMGMLSLIAQDPHYAQMREAVGLDAGSRVFLISTEGATDSDIYRRRVPEGPLPPLP